MHLAVRHISLLGAHFFLRRCDCKVPKHGTPYKAHLAVLVFPCMLFCLCCITAQKHKRNWHLCSHLLTHGQISTHEYVFQLQYISYTLNEAHHSPTVMYVYLLLHYFHWFGDLLLESTRTFFIDHKKLFRQT